MRLFWMAATAALALGCAPAAHAAKELHRVALLGVHDFNTGAFAAQDELFHYRGFDGVVSGDVDPNVTLQGTYSFSGLDSSYQWRTANLAYEAKAGGAEGELKAAVSASLTDGFYSEFNSPYFTEEFDENGRPIVNPDGYPSVVEVFVQTNFGDVIEVTGEDLAYVTFDVAFDGNIGTGDLGPGITTWATVYESYLHDPDAPPGNGNFWSSLLWQSYTPGAVDHQVLSRQFQVVDGKVTFGFGMHTGIYYEMAALADPGAPISTQVDFFNTLKITGLKGFDSTGKEVVITSAKNSDGFDYAAGGGYVPEPSTWALLILGFGGAGAALRRRRALAV